MFRPSILPVTLAVLLALPAVALAGGPPMMCLPVTGASSANAEATAQHLASALGKDIDRASLRQNDGRWYLTFHFNREGLRLAEIEKALAGSGVAIDREAMRMFGDIKLELKISEAAGEKLLADLKTVKHATIEETKGDMLLITLKLPAPTYEFRPPAEFATVAFADQKFQRDDGSQPAVAAKELPSYSALSKLAAKHDGQLVGLRWECWGCRALGCVADGKLQRTAQAASAR
jgi:hypothetical protein